MYEYRVNSRPPIVIYIDYNHLKEKKLSSKSWIREQGTKTTFKNCPNDHKR